MPRVYVETSFFSQCVTVRTGVIDIGRRAVSLDWWHTQARNFDLCISPEVVRELSDENFPAQVREPALAMLAGLEVLAFTREVLAIAEILVEERVMPRPAVDGDALHVAFSVAYRTDYLLTWNQKHLANPRKRTHLAVICTRLNLQTPQIVTPDLLIVEDRDE